MADLEPEDLESYEYEGKVYKELLGPRLVWSLGHFDGVMSGIAVYNGDYYYAKCHQSPYTNKSRYFWLYKLTPEETAKEIKYNEKYKKYVGLYCNYDEQGKRRKDPRNWKEWLWEISRFFTRSHYLWSSSKCQNRLGINRDEYTKREAIGYFRLMRK